MLDEYGKNQKEREVPIARIEIRAEMRSSTDEEENSAVIDQRLLEAQARGEVPKVESSAPPAKLTIWNVTYTAVRRMPPMGIVIVIVVGMLCYTFLRASGVFKWP